MHTTLLLILLNAGSPFLWASGLHLFVGNLFIGTIEYYFVSKKYYTDIGMILIILGNYVSMFFGMFFIAPYIAQRFMGTTDYFGMNEKYNLEGIGLGMAFAFIASFLIEFPFFYFAVRRKHKITLVRGLVVTTVAQLVTYGLILGYYAFVLLA